MCDTIGIVNCVNSIHVKVAQLSLVGGHVVKVLSPDVVWGVGHHVLSKMTGGS